MSGADGGEAKLRSELRAFVEDNFLYLRPDLELADSDDLLALGVIDSLGFVELVEEVQARYGVTVTDEEITVDNLGSIDALVRYVASRSAA